MISGEYDPRRTDEDHARPSPDRERSVNSAFSESPSQRNIRAGLREGGYDPDDEDDMLRWGRHQRINREQIEAVERRRRRIAAIGWGAASSAIAIILSNVIPWLMETIRRLMGDGGGASGH